MEDPEGFVEHGGQRPQAPGIDGLRHASLHEPHRRLAGHEPLQGRQRAGPGMDLQREAFTAQQAPIRLRDRVVGAVLTAGGDDDRARRQRTLEVIRRGQADRDVRAPVAS